MKQLLIIALVLGGYALQAQEMEFTVIEKQPEFPGGNEALQQYLDERIKGHNTTGRVFMGFTVNVDSTISNIRVLRGLNPDIDSLCVDIVRDMPKWSPAISKKKPVKYNYSLPISFK